MNSDDFRRRAALVREIPLEVVLSARGAERDRRDRSKWHTEQGPVSVTGPKFMNWHQVRGGGGAIDLVIHLADVDYRTAVAWLEQHFAVSHVTVISSLTPSAQRSSAERSPRKLQLPIADNRMLGRVRHYLTGDRHLATSLLAPLIADGKLYADRHGNAVFLMVTGKPNRPIGAELRGTGAHVWRGLAPGSRKDRGYFWIGAKGSREIVLCESAIDAISCFQLQPDRICISTAGVRSNPQWLRSLIGHGYQVACGFDADEAGDTAAIRMISNYPEIKRLRPPAHDWNDALASSR